MGSEENKALVRRWIEEAMPAALRDPDQIEALVAEFHHEYLTTRTPRHHHHTESGFEGLKNEVRTAAAGFSDVEVIVVDEILAEGDLVSVHWTLKESPTTDQGSLCHYGGKMDAGGKALSVSGLGIYRVKDGKISESWTYTNVLDVLLTNGVMKLQPAR